MSASTYGEITRQQVEKFVEDSGRKPPCPLSEETVTSCAFKTGFLASMVASLLNGQRDMDRLRKEIAGVQQ